MTTFLWYIIKNSVILILFGTIGADYKTHQLLETPTHRLSLITKGDTEHLKRTAGKILIPRVVGTANHDKVRDFIINSMENLQWSIEHDIFEDDTPNMGRLTFENIVATLNPDADRFLVLACHYDSKYFPGEDFIGATDSAIPCAMLINLAHVLNNYLKSNSNKNHISIKLIFFDGEEAFENWSELDSIYGAKHLAQKWEKKRVLEKIDVLVLLDLIGMPDPTFYNYFKKTLKYYVHLMGIEERLAANNYLERYTASSASKSLPNAYFQPHTSNVNIEDDHIPFLVRGVPTVHLIPQPFPEVWHKMGDNASVIDYSTVENINKILRVFVIEYLRIEV